jgi:hypothetical protein
MGFDVCGMFFLQIQQKAKTLEKAKTYHTNKQETDSQTECQNSG